MNGLLIWARTSSNLSRIRLSTASTSAARPRARDPAPGSDIGFASGQNHRRSSTILAHASAAYYTSPWPGSHPAGHSYLGVLDLRRIGRHGSQRHRAPLIGAPGPDAARPHRPGFRARFHRTLVRAGDAPSGHVPLEHEYKVMGLAPYGTPPGDRNRRGAAVSGPVRVHQGRAVLARVSGACRRCMRPMDSCERTLGGSASTLSRPGRRRSSNTCSRLGCATPCGRPASAGSPAPEACS